MRLALLLALLLPFAAHAQGTSPWQQRVAYRMNIEMDAPRHQFTGTQTLTLENNSPDTLRHVYYHLYFNAFQPNSLMAERNRQLPDPDGRVVPRIFNLGPDEIGYHRVDTLLQDGRPVAFRVDDTVLRAELARPIPPGTSSTFEMRFHSQVPLQTRRSGRDSREGIDFSMAQWYPKLAQYDTRGWHADPYIGREFYAPFGTFDVRITIPTEYTIGATGVLQNADQIGHGYSAREVAHAPGTMLTWHFRAENVHDFAWAADRDYVHDRIEGQDGRTYHLLYQPDVAEGWQFLRQFVPAVIQYLSRRVGEYPWPQFTVAQAGDGGMEYPMINFITGGRTPGSLVGVTAHEAAHEWFYGTLGSNESDFAWMDEGFTDFMTDEVISALLTNRPANHRGSTLAIMGLQENGLYEPISSPSDWFETNRAYSTASYSGGAMIADQLGYILGDSLRDAFFRAYYREFKFRHPQPADVERVAEKVSGIELDWYFQQTTRDRVRMDYAIEGLASIPTGGAWQTMLELEREDEMLFPLDVRLTMEDGSEQWVTIPVSEMGRAKPVPASWVVAPAWGWTRPGYTLRLATPQKVVSAEIDPLGRTPDHNRLNNATRMPKDVAFLEAPTPTLDHYSVGWRPLAVYADRFGPGIGVQARGTYWMGRHQTKAMLTVYPLALDVDNYVSSRDFELTVPDVPGRSPNDAVDYTLAYSSGLRAVSPQTRLMLSAEKHVGVMQNRVEVSHTFGRWAALGRDRGRLTLFGVHTLQPTVRGFFYGPSPNFNRNVFGGDHAAYLGARYEAGRGGNRISADVQVGGSFRREAFNFTNEQGTVQLRLPFERSSATRLTLRAQKSVPVGPLALRARTLVGFGSDALALYQRFQPGAATYEEIWQNAATRQIHAAENDLYDDVPLRSFSGFGPVGYMDRLAGGSTQAWMGTVEAALPRPKSALLAPFEASLFSGATIQAGGQRFGTSTQRFSLDNLIADAGVALTYDVSVLRSLRRWTAQSDVLQNLKLAARFPLWLSDPEIIGSEEDAFAFRYFLGIEVRW